MPDARYTIKHPLPRGLSAEAMPRTFGSALDEVVACQRSTALFDYSFLLRLRVEGLQAAEAVSNLCRRDFSSMAVGTVRYALYASSSGQLISDLTVWQIGPETIDIMSGRAADVREITAALVTYDVNVFDLSDQTAALALQGPATNACLQELVDRGEVAEIPSFGFRELGIVGKHCLVGRLGFTGLDGVEILCTPDDASRLWQLLAQMSRPAGFMAADMLRLKAGLPLFSQEFAPPVTAADIGLSRIWKPFASATEFLEPQVARVLFRARWASDTTTALPDVLWTDGGAFPPPVNTVAVTSICNNPTAADLIGMGYVSLENKSNQLSDTAGLLSNIQLIKIFGEQPP